MQIIDIIWKIVMKHVIIGAGVVGTATGVWLIANHEEVKFYDVKSEALKKLENRGYKVLSNLKKINADIFWIATTEWHVDEVISHLINYTKNPTIVIRSTTPPGTIENLIKKYNLKHVAHVPEFLRAKTAILDIFEKDRIIVGVNDEKTKSKLKQLFQVEMIEVIYTDPTTSELIKYASNCWLATQISYWNEIKKICDKFKVNPQLVANAACLDKRISKYGTAMIGEAFSGFCLPKDIDSLILSFKSKKINPILLKAVKKVNETIKKEKMGK